MSTRPPYVLIGALSLAHGADQLALSSLPLIAVTLLGASPAIVGMLVAAQGAAWVLVALPAGPLIDQLDARRLFVGAQALAVGALVVAALLIGFGSVPGLGIFSFLAGAGAVVTAVAGYAVLPRLVAVSALPRANARLETGRALVAVAAPITAGFLADRGHADWAVLLAAGVAVIAIALFASGRQLPPAPTLSRPPLLNAIAEGFHYLVDQPVLFGLTICALFWNAAYFALLAVAVPHLVAVAGLDPAAIGLGQAATGLGQVLGSLAAPILIAQFTPRTVLIFGPLGSILAAALIATAHSLPPVAIGQFMLGFGPSIWLVAQTSLRQTLTPPALLGRVGATLQAAIYGVRPVGALLGGLLAQLGGTTLAMMLVVILFALSFLTVPLSALGRLRQWQPA